MKETSPYLRPIVNYESFCASRTIWGFRLRLFRDIPPLAKKRIFNLAIDFVLGKGIQYDHGASQFSTTMGLKQASSQQEAA